MNSAEISSYLLTKQVPASVKRLNQQLEEVYRDGLITQDTCQSYRLEEIKEL